MKILIADDSRVGRTYVQRTLSLTGVSEADLLLAKNGQEALEIIEKQQSLQDAVGVLLLDINMPILDGLQLVEQLEQKGYLGKLRIIVTSSLLDDSRKARLQGKGVTHFLQKPFPPEALNAVFQLLRS